MNLLDCRHLQALLAVVTLGLLSGCSTPSDSHAPPGSSSGSTAAPVVEPSGEGKASAAKRYLTSDGRTVRIGSWTSSNGGRDYKNPNLNRCWLADGFTFVGYDVLYLTPITTSLSPAEPRAQEMLRTAQSRLLDGLKAKFSNMGLFSNVVTQPQDIPAGAKVLRLDQKITEFARGSGAARFWAGTFGAGQPVLKVEGTLQDGNNEKFAYTARRHGDSVNARMDPGWTKEETLQLLDIEDIIIDFTDFVGVVSGKYSEKK